MLILRAFSKARAPSIAKPVAPNLATFGGLNRLHLKQPNNFFFYMRFDIEFELGQTLLVLQDTATDLLELEMWNSLINYV